MKEFFSTNNFTSYKLNTAEKIVPFIVVLLLLISICYFAKIVISNSLIDKSLRNIMGTLQLIFFISDYLPLWIKYGFKVYNLPFHLSSISAILCIILAFSKKKQIFDFVIFTGVIGGIGTLFFPNLHYSWHYYRYFQFMGNHILIIIIPLYFTIVHNYVPDFKATLKAFIMMQLLIVSLGTLNTFYSTNFMFIQFGDKVSQETALLPTLGQGYFYLINIELLGTMLFLLWYKILQLVIYRTKKHYSPSVEFPKLAK